MSHIYKDSPTGAVARARTLRRDTTDAEKCLWRALRQAFPRARFRRQVPGGPYIADFLSFGAMLVVEADGGQHAGAVADDKKRTAYLEGKGFRVLRFWNNDVLGNVDGVLAAIVQALSPSPSHSAMPSGPLPLPMGEGM